MGRYSALPRVNGPRGTGGGLVTRARGSALQMRDHLLGLLIADAGTGAHERCGRVRCQRDSRLARIGQLSRGSGMQVPAEHKAKSRTQAGPITIMGVLYERAGQAWR